VLEVIVGVLKEGLVVWWLGVVFKESYWLKKNIYKYNK
jgi:hypothetical protein